MFGDRGAIRGDDTAFVGYYREDNLRVYRLTEPKEKHVQVYGLDGSVDFEEPLVL